MRERGGERRELGKQRGVGRRMDKFENKNRHRRTIRYIILAFGSR